MDTRGVSLGNGCSIPEFFDIYRAGAPNLDILAPNSYMQQLDWICQAFAWKGNPILIPESTVSGARALYAVGEWDAIAFSPFGIDGWADGVLENPGPGQCLFSDSYALLRDADSLVCAHLGSGTMRGAYLYPGHSEEYVTIGDYDVTFDRMRSFDIGALMSPAGGDFATPARQSEDRFEGGAILIQTGKDEFYLMGYGVNADFRLKARIPASFCGYDRIEEGTFRDGVFVPGRLLNGDERNAYLPDGRITVLRIRLYHL
jgi:hypothetical protein